MRKYTCLTKFSRLMGRPFPEKNVHHNFEFSSKSGPHLFWNSRELWLPQWVKMQEYTCFPKSSRQNSDFPGKFSPKFLVFTKIWGRHFREFPGILVDKITKNSRIYGFPRILEISFRFFPGNFHEIPKSPIFLNFRKPRNFGERVTSTKKAPNFQFSPCFSLNFV